MENTFWDITKLGDGKFRELFQKSFTLYVKSGVMKIVEIDIDMLRNEQGEFSVNKDFEAKFYRFIVDHYLRKFHCFHLYLTHLSTFLKTAISGEFQARARGESVGGESNASEEQRSGEPWASARGGQAFELERKIKTFFTWLRNLMPKFRRRQRAWWDWNLLEDK